MSFDIEGAKKAGYSEAEIADHLAQEARFDAPAARKAGYSDAEIISHMSGTKAAPAPKQEKEPSNWSVANNAINKGIAGGIDTVLNVPANMLQLAKAGAGVVINKSKLPENKYNPMAALIRASGVEMPDAQLPPGLLGGAMTKAGFINQGAEPQTGLQRVIDMGGQFVGGSVINPANSLRQAGTNAAKSGLAGMLAGGTKEATGSDNAAMLTGLLAPSTINRLGNSARNSIQNAKEINARNATENATIEAGRKLGLVLPPTQTKDSFINNRLESIAGRAALKQETTLRNQTKTNQAIAKDVDLSPNSDITEGKLKARRAEVSGPFQEVRKMDALKLDADYKDNGMGPRPFVGALGAKSIPAGDALDAIKQLRADAKSYFAQNNGNPAPDIKAKAQASQKAADQLEGLIDRNASTDLLPRLRQARADMAKTYTVENALNLGSGNVSAPSLGRAFDKGVPLEGNMRDIAKFALAKRPFMGEASGAPAPGVSALEPVLALGGAATGGVAGTLAGGLPLLRGPVRSLLLSEPYQKYMAKTGVSPSMMAQLLSKLPPNTPPEVALQAITSGRITLDNAQPKRLSDLLRGQ